MSKIYKCEGCGGLLVFDPDSQALRCEYCKSIYHFAGGSKPGVFKQPYSGSLVYKQEKETNPLYECCNCHTRLTGNQDTPVTRCVSCSSTDLKKVKGEGVHPTALIPFKISKKKASECFAEWIETRKFAPNDLKKMAKLEKMSGFYAPVYSFDLTAVTEYSAVGINNWKDKEGREHSSSKKVCGTESKEYLDYIVSASRAVGTEVYAGFGGYDTADVVGGPSEYLLGFSGVNTDFDVHFGHMTMRRGVENKEEFRIRELLKTRFDEVSRLRITTTIRNVFNCYYFAPIWVNHYRYKNKDYNCYVNGQTGKVFGKAPKSIWKILALVLGVTAFVVFVAYLLTR